MCSAWLLRIQVSIDLCPVLAEAWLSFREQHEVFSVRCKPNAMADVVAPVNAD